MSENNLKKHLNEEYIDLGACSLGRNLNLLSIRGFARLDELAIISGPDTQNDFENPEGTQRPLAGKHSLQALQYALGSLDLDPAKDARAFPEVILNARNTKAVQFYDLTSKEILDETLEVLVPSGLVGVRISLEQIEYPVQPYAPDISRVDGNHRLEAAQISIEANPEIQSYPSVPFSMHVGLSKLQERKIFRDINFNHKVMDANIIKAIDITNAAEDGSTLPRPLLIAAQLRDEGRAFEGMVLMGGGDKEYKNLHGRKAPLKINMLVGAVKDTLDSSNQLKATFDKRSDIQLDYIDTFWKAVKSTMPEMWADPKTYLLFTTVGLNAMSQWAGTLIDLAIQTGADDSEDFYAPYVMAAKETISFEKKNASNTGLAGRAGVKVFFTRLVQAATPDAVNTQRVLLKKTPKDSIDSAFGDDQ